ncbi:hypothetical protein TRIHO_19870 [Tritonibacter horizontis]|uniref:Uncharacterized protein n=1 Tax=Tritonibacter horizontis TaxID=1768241 RepID=A0A132BXH7_9RHOB|nr:hypothetical protein TRIHO_19870 [Tritonibacter horizontis]
MPTLDKVCDGTRESDLVFASTPIPHAWHLHGHRTNAGHHLAFGQMTVSDQACPPVLELVPGEGVHERGQLGVDRLFDQLARSIAQNVGERVGAKS